MNLSQIQLQAFQEVVRSGSFTKAAEALHLTQSALSHRIRNLEESLERTLFLRMGKQIRLTADGERLLQFCRTQSQFEEEFLSGWSSKQDLAGTLRVGGVSTLVRSVALPSIAGLLKSHPKVKLELYTRELRDIPLLLSSGEADMVLSTQALEGFAFEKIGQEENILIEPVGVAPLLYLDHDHEDRTTMDFFKLQKKQPEKIDRLLLDDIYGILDGVSQGLGRAVVPRHLLSVASDVRVIRGLLPLKTPVYLIYVKQPYYPKIHLLARAELKRGAAKILQA